MQITSYFIAVDLKIEILKALFKKIKIFLKENNLTKDIILQNVETAHITLYYLTKNSDYKTIKHDLIQFKATIKENIFVEDFSYFYRNNQEFICYLKPSFSKCFYDYNSLFKSKYKNFWAEDNDLEFVPHISLLKILDYKKFRNFKKEIENILQTEIDKIKNIDINAYSISLYWADSTKVPELQFII